MSLEHAKLLAELEERLRFETLIADLSSKFVNLPIGGEVDREIKDAQRRICELLGLDFSALWHGSSGTPGFFILTHFYSSFNNAQPLEQMHQDQYPWAREQLLAGRTIKVSSLADLPPEAARDRDTLRQFGIKSNLALPLSVGGGPLMGILGLGTLLEERDWPDALVKRLQLLAQIFANALARKRAETAFRTSEARLAAGTDLAGLGYYEIDYSAHTCFLDDRFRHICGVPQDLQQGLDPVVFWMEHVHAGDRQQLLDERQKLHDGRVDQISSEYRYAHPAHGEQWIHHLARIAGRNASGGGLRTFGVIRDITEAKKAEAALRASEEVNRATFDQAAVGIAHVSTDGRWLRVNDKLCAIVGYSRDELLQMTFQDITHPDDLETDVHYLRQVLSGEIKTYSLEKRYLHKDRSIVWVVLTVSLVQTVAGAPLHFISVVQDITERKQTEAELLRQRTELAHIARVSSMGELAASLAHELNQPLGAILANAEAAELFLEQDPPALNELHDILAAIRKDDERAAEVINRMRSLLRKRALERRPIEVNSLVEEVRQLVSGDAALRGISLTSDLVPELPKISGDHVHLQQVLLNLVLNGMDAVACLPRERRRLSISTRLGADGQVELAVIDSGPGIEPASLSRLFEPFYTTKPNGMGMGLSITRTIVEAHRGRIWAENIASGGAAFRIVLPIMRSTL
jgi:PAS domain S-box-containing protein